MKETLDERSLPACDPILDDCLALKAGWHI